MSVVKNIMQECPRCKVGHMVGSINRPRSKPSSSIEHYVELPILYKCPNCNYVYFEKRSLDDSELKQLDRYLNSKEYAKLFEEYYEVNPWYLVYIIYSNTNRTNDETAQVLLTLYLNTLKMNDLEALCGCYTNIQREKGNKDFQYFFMLLMQSEFWRRHTDFHEAKLHTEKAQRDLIYFEKGSKEEEWLMKMFQAQSLLIKLENNQALLINIKY